MWPSAGEPSAGIGAIETLIVVVPDGRTRVPGAAKTCACGGCSGVATATSGLRPPLIGMSAVEPFASPARPGGGFSQRYGSTGTTPS